MSNPIVFVPGLFGSLGDDVIKGTGDFSFGFAEDIYRPFIDILNSMGYIENENLFISFYDWKKPCEFIARKYLATAIDKARYKSGSRKVDIICHSMGGLVTRAYIQDLDYRDDVDKVIMVGVPNAGVVNSYFFWSGGVIPYSKVEENIFYKVLKVGFGMYLKTVYKMSYIELLRKVFPSSRDLLPSYEYGDYLMLEDDSYEKETIPIVNMKTRNDFLNELKHKGWMGVDTYIIGGKGKKTNKYLSVDIDTKNGTKWLDGKPKNIYTTNLGDGTVVLGSSISFYGENLVLEGDHVDILYKSKDFLSQILNRKATYILEQEKKTNQIYNIIATNCNIISSNLLDIEDDNISTIKLGENSYWIRIKDVENIEFNTFDQSILGTEGNLILFNVKENGEVKYEFR